MTSAKPYRNGRSIEPDTFFDLIQQFWDASLGLTMDNGETKRA